MRRSYWLDAVANFNIQPSEFDRLPVGRMRDLETAIDAHRAEVKKGG